MFFFVGATTVLVILWLLHWWKNVARVNKFFPPGPIGLPILGYVPIFGADNFLSGIEALHAKFGSVFSLNIGPSPRTVVIGDFEALKVGADPQGTGYFLDTGYPMGTEYPPGHRVTLRVQGCP